MSSVLLPITCTICLSNTFQDCATSQRLMHLLPTAPYIGFQSDCWNAVHNIIIPIIMPICIKKWWQHWPAHTRAMLAYRCHASLQWFIKLTCTSWREWHHYVHGSLQIGTRCLECCVNGMYCLWNVCSAHQVMQSAHMLYTYQAAGQDEAHRVLSYIVQHIMPAQQSLVTMKRADVQQHCVRTSTPGTIRKLDITTVVAF